MTAPRGAGKVRRLGEQPGRNPFLVSDRGAVVHADCVEAQGEVVLLSHGFEQDWGGIVTGFPLGGALLKHLSSASLANR